MIYFHVLFILVILPNTYISAGFSRLKEDKPQKKRETIVTQVIITKGELRELTVKEAIPLWQNFKDSAMQESAEL